MKFGIIPVNVGVQSADQMIGMAQAAEELGFDSVWTFEHVIVPHDYESKYPYNKSGKMAADPETNFVDPLIALTAIAQATKTIKLATGINIVSQTNPLLLAKQAASLDFVSGGRFMLGAGIGWLREEFEAMGTPFEKRGARFDDYMVAMKKVWSGETVEHESEFLSWHGFKSYPVPVQKPGVPVHMGGNKGKIFERIAKYGDGWFIPGANLKHLPGQLDELKSALEGEGREIGEIELSTIWVPQMGREMLDEMEKLGVERAVIMPSALGGDGGPGALKDFAKDYIG